MNFIKKYLFFIALLMPFACIAQKDSSKTFSISINPQYLFVNTVKLDLEARIPALKGSITVSPYIYSGKTQLYSNKRNPAPDNSVPSDDKYNFDKLSGWGIEGMYKYIIQKDKVSGNAVYMGVGAGYHDIKMAFTDYTWEQYTDAGLQYYQYRSGDQSESIKRTDIIGIIGYKGTAGNLLTFDLYGGLDIKKSTVTSTLFTPREYNTAILDYGYNGVVLRLGVSIGLMLF